MNGEGKKAAARLMNLKGLGESDAEFARRLGLTSQNIHNWTSGTHGLSLKMAMKIAPKLTDAEIVYVVAGRPLDSPDSEDAAYVRGLREAFAEAREALNGAEEELARRYGFAPSTPPPSTAADDAPESPDDSGDGVDPDAARQLGRAAAARKAKRETESKERGEGA